jgi:hypothetical protein
MAIDNPEDSPSTINSNPEKSESWIFTSPYFEAQEVSKSRGSAKRNHDEDDAMESNNQPEIDKNSIELSTPKTQNVLKTRSLHPDRGTIKDSGQISGALALAEGKVVSRSPLDIPVTQFRPSEAKIRKSKSIDAVFSVPIKGILQSAIDYGTDSTRFGSNSILRCDEQNRFYVVESDGSHQEKGVFEAESIYKLEYANNCSQLFLGRRTTQKNGSARILIAFPEARNVISLVRFIEELKLPALKAEKLSR